MLQKFSKLLGFKPDETRTVKELHLATAVLLVHVSLEHENFNDAEQKSVLKSLQDHFGLTADMAQKIVDLAVKREEESLELYSFTRIITQELDQPGRQDIVRLLWRVAFADGHLDHYETHIITKICGLLGVSLRDRTRIKQEVQAEREKTSH